VAEPRRRQPLTDVLQDPLTGRRVVYAPGRSDRPGAWLPELEPATEDELERCPFDAGREDRTPPETLRLGDPWQVRVVPNLYPAFDRQEVVIHSPEHVRSFAELDDDHVELVAEAWQRRMAEEGGPALALVNEGRLAGSSLPHSHSQLVWLELPDEPVNELPRLLERHPVLHRGDVVAAVHPVGAAPYESLIGPRERDGELADGLFLLRDVVRRLQRLEGHRPWNAWLHPGPPWHLHFVPRLTALAGIELGAGIYVNVIPPERAAERLRTTS
jgi:UDPglucose--hexose-1-phosphate uridylyltransferase